MGCGDGASCGSGQLSGLSFLFFLQFNLSFLGVNNITAKTLQLRISPMATGISFTVAIQ